MWNDVNVLLDWSSEYEESTNQTDENGNDSANLIPDFNN